MEADSGEHVLVRNYWKALLFAAAFCVLGSIPASATAAPPIATTEAATAVSYEEATLKGSVNPEGSATSYWFEYGKTTSYGTKIPVSPASVGSGTSPVGVSQTPTGLSQGTEYHFRVVAESEAGTTEGEDATFKTAGFNFAFGEEGSGNGQLKQPNLGIATDSEGNIWVADTENNRVEKFNSKGEYLSQFGKEGTGNGEFKAPKGLAIDSSDDIWVVDSGNNRVEKFNAKGEYLGKVGEKGSGEAQFESPTGIALDNADRPFVVDTGNNRVEKFNASFKYLAQFGKKGTGDGEFKSPTGIEIDAGGRIWVTDTGNDRVQKFNPSTLAFSSKFGGAGSGEGQFESPTGIASDFQEKLWIVDSGNDRVQKFDIEGNPRDQLGEKGIGAGQLGNPTGIAAPVAQRLLVLDTGNNRVEGWTVKAEPPTAATNPVTNTTLSSAVLHGNIDPEALVTAYYFEYGTTTSYGTKSPIPPESIGSGSSNVLVEQTIPVTGLDKGITYNFRVVAESAAGVTVGKNRTIKLKTPVATTVATTEVKLTQATLKAKVNPSGWVTNYWFEYGTTTSYGTKIPVSPKLVDGDFSSHSVSQTPTGLSEGTTYHFRVVAESEGGSDNGADMTFRTLGPPKVTTEAATAVKATQATLNAKVNPNGSATTYYFDYGTTESYGTKIPVSPTSVGSGTSDVPVSQAPTGLSSGTTYHFRILAESEEGIVSGEDKSFTTLNLKLPKVTTEAATAIKATQATLNGTVNPEGSATSYYFEYGKTTSYGTKIPVSPESVGGGTSDVPVSQTPTGLSQGTEYHFRVVAESEAGTVKGADETLTTLKLPKATTEAATAIKLTQATLNGTVNPEGSAAKYWFEYGKTTSYGTKIPVSPESVGSGTSDVAVSQTPTGLSEGTTYHFRVVAESETGINKGADKTFTTGPSFSFSFGTAGSGNGQFSELADITTDPEGNVWVADTWNNRIQKFNSKGEYLLKFGSEGSGKGQFLYPYGITTDPEGNIWVADTGNNRVQELNSKGEYLAEFGSEGSGEGQFLYPEGVATDPEGNIWVADTGNNRVQELNSKGEYLAEFGSEGSGEGQFLYPGDIATDSEGNVWVADSGNNRVQEFSGVGEYLQKFGLEGSGNGQFLYPHGIATDPEGNVWVADTENNRVEGFNSKGEYLLKFGSEGFGKGQFFYPLGIATDSEGNTWVTDTGNSRVQKWIR